MTDKGTVAYKAESLSKLIEQYEGIIKPADDELEKEWEDWEEASSQEIEELKVGCTSIEGLRVIFEDNKKILSQDSINQKTEMVSLNFLWWKWTEERYEEEAIQGLCEGMLANAIAEILRESAGGDDRITVRHDYPFRDYAEGLRREYCPHTKVSNEMIGSVDSYSLSGIFSILTTTRGTIISPEMERYNYCSHIRTIGQLRKLVELPGSELITLGDELADSLHGVREACKQIKKGEDNTEAVD